MSRFDEMRPNLVAGGTGSPSRYQPGQLLAGRYRIVSILGAGGMGLVYKAEQVAVGKELALKTIENKMVSDSAVRRFQAEARATFALNHPNVVSVYDFGVFDDQVPYLAMEIVHGSTLAARISEQPLMVPQAVPIFQQICAGLGHAHARGVVHRDVKPTNIMLVARSEGDSGYLVKILDFGIAKLTDDGNSVSNLTQTGEIFGSPLYMSPEQCMGGVVDHRSDIYSLGCVFYESLTGNPPFQGPTALSTIMMHKTSQPPSLKEASLGSEFPPALEAVVQKMLAKNPNDRYQSLAQVSERLEELKLRTDVARVQASAVTAQMPLQKKPATPTAKTFSLSRINFVLILSGLFLTGCLLGGIPAFYLKPHKIAVAPEPEKYVTPFVDLEQADKNPYEADINKKLCSFRGTGPKVVNDDALAVFEGCKEAQKLELRDGNVSEAGLAHLAKSNLLDLRLNNCGISSVDTLGKLFPNLRNLDLQSAAIDDSALPKIARMRNLEELDLRGCKIPESKWINLGSSTSLTTVDMPHLNASEATMSALRKELPHCHFPGYFDHSYAEEVLSAKDKEAKKPLSVRQKLDILKNIDPRSTILIPYYIGLAELAWFNQNLAETEHWLVLGKRLAIANSNKRELVRAISLEAALAGKNKKYALCDDLMDKAFQLCLEIDEYDLPATVKDFDRILQHPDGPAHYPKLVKNCATACNIIERFMPNNLDAREQFYERTGWYLHVDNDQAGALPFFKKNLELCASTREQHPDLYARALVEMGHAEPDVQKKKEYYREGISLIHRLNYPVPFNLREHCCDAYSSLMNIAQDESNFAEAVSLGRSALSAALKITTDNNLRANYFRSRLNDAIKLNEEHERKAQKNVKVDESK